VGGAFIERVRTRRTSGAVTRGGGKGRHELTDVNTNATNKGTGEESQEIVPETCHSSRPLLKGFSEELFPYVRHHPLSRMFVLKGVSKTRNCRESWGSQ